MRANFAVTQAAGAVAAAQVEDAVVGVDITRQHFGFQRGDVGVVHRSGSVAFPVGVDLGVTLIAHNCPSNRSDSGQAFYIILSIIAEKVKRGYNPFGIGQVADDVFDRQGQFAHQGRDCDNLFAFGQLRVT